MYEIIFYEDVNGYSDVESYIRTLRNRAKTSKDARINLNKIVAYMDILEELGTRVGEPVTKHLDGERVSYCIGQHSYPGNLIASIILYQKRCCKIMSEENCLIAIMGFM